MKKCRNAWRKPACPNPLPPFMKTLLEVLQSGTEYLARQGCDEARATMQHLMAHVLHCNRTALYSQFDRPVEEEELAPLRQLLKRKGRRRTAAAPAGNHGVFPPGVPDGRPRPDSAAGNGRTGGNGTEQDSRPSRPRSGHGYRVRNHRHHAGPGIKGPRTGSRSGGHFPQGAGSGPGKRHEAGSQGFHHPDGPV